MPMRPSVTYRVSAYWIALLSVFFEEMTGPHGVVRLEC
jgi:hypothetical protein